MFTLNQEIVFRVILFTKVGKSLEKTILRQEDFQDVDSYIKKVWCKRLKMRA